MKCGPIAPISLAVLLVITVLSPLCVGVPASINIEGPRPEIGLNVNITAVNFVAAPNDGSRISVPAEVSNPGSSPVFVVCNLSSGSSLGLRSDLTINGRSWDDCNVTLSAEGSASLIVSCLPQSANSGGIVFWAEPIAVPPLENVPASADWATFQGENCTGATGNVAPITAPDQALSWKAHIGQSGMAGLDVAPITADGKLFAVDYQGLVYAFNTTTGTLIWSNTELGPKNTFELSTPLYHNGTLYVAFTKKSTDNGFSVHAINASTGQVIWSKRDFGTGFAQPNTPIVYDNGHIYLGIWYPSETPGTYYCLNATDGGILWQRDASTPVGYYWSGSVVIGPYLVYGDLGGYLVSVDKLTGELVEELSLADTYGTAVDGMRSSIAYSEPNGRIYFSDRGGYCYALGFDASSGHFDTADKWATHIGFSTSTPALYDGRLYVGTGDFSTANGVTLYCLNESDGAVLWTFVANGGIQASPVVSTYYDDGDGEVYIYFTTNTLYGRIYCLNGNGTEAWHFEPEEGEGQYTLQGVAIYGGKVIFGNDAGYLFALGGH